MDGQNGLGKTVHPTHTAIDYYDVMCGFGRLKQFEESFDFVTS